jgi:glycosyltransferase involved in cell wall biosynthesis
VVGSFQEGFSVAMVEELACGRPIVSTSVSGADEMIIEGQNGYVVKSRDPAEFAGRMLAAARLPEAGRVSRGLAETRYSERKLWQQIAAEWPPLQ